jgi:hypothetical protein
MSHPDDFDTSDLPTQKEIRMTTHNIDGVLVTVTDTEVQYEAGAAIDCDGAPNAYALPSSGHRGLDNIFNALEDPRNTALDKYGDPIGPWAGVILGHDGKPYIQDSGPFQGYCLSSTALFDPHYPETDYRRFVDATRIAYISIPPAIRNLGVRLGDGALVADRETAQSIQCIVADIGPRKRLGEVSVLAAQGMGFADSSPRTGGAGKGIIVRIFLNSAATPAWAASRTQDDVATLVDKFSAFV